MGGRPESYIGKTPEEFFGQTEGNSIGDVVQEVFKTGQPIIDREITPTIRLGRTYRYSIVPVLNDTSDLFGVFAISQDVTSQKQSEDAVKKK